MKQTIKRGDIFFAELHNYDERSQVQSGRRPVLVVSCAQNLKTSNVITVVTLSSQLKSMHIPCHIFVPKEHTGLPRDSVVLCEQPMSIDTYLLKEKVGSIQNSEHMTRVDNGLRIQLSL